jgi:beta-barrel assembly-enhancing protease
MAERIVLVVYLTFLQIVAVAQTQQQKSRAKIIECKSPFSKIKVDLLDDESDFIKEYPIGSETKILNKKGEPEKVESLKPGHEITVEATKQGYKWTLNQITVNSTKVGSKVKVNGKLEKYVNANDYAIIDGRKVKLAENTKIFGKNELKNQSYKSFGDVTQGYYIEAEGEHRPDGIVYATSAYLKPDNFTNIDLKLRTSMNSDFSSSLMKQTASTGDSKKLSDSVSTGKLRFGDLEYTIVENQKLQAYVTNIGNKIVPFYQKEIPTDVPEKLNFKFVVVDNPMPNMQTMPNGLVIINSGIMQMLDNEAQFASVLGHEVAHCTHKHASERFEQQEKSRERKENTSDAKEILNPFAKRIAEKSKIISSGAKQVEKIEDLVAKLPPQSKSAYDNLITSAKGIVDNNFNKENEEQADRIGLIYMQEAGYNPLESARVWEKFMIFSSNETKMAELKNYTNSWVTATDRYTYKNPLTSVGDVISANIINTLLDNNFSDHPKAKARYRSLNLLVAENFTDVDLSKSIVNEKEYQEIKLLLPAPKK